MKETPAALRPSIKCQPVLVLILRNYKKVFEHVCVSKNYNMSLFGKRKVDLVEERTMHSRKLFLLNNISIYRSYCGHTTMLVGYLSLIMKCVDTNVHIYLFSATYR